LTEAEFVSVTIDPTINIGNLLTGLVMLAAFSVWAFKAGGDFAILKNQVEQISKKLDSFISRDILAEKEKRADDVHSDLQRQIDELKADRG
jgi:hypothetical protein